MDTIGIQLKALRNRHGLSQRQLALRAGVSNATVSLIEHGHTDPSLGLLKRILDALGVSFAEFFSAPGGAAEKYFYASDELRE
ncbi:MAG: helix-turn-helix domain-containing protein, partial [Woeseiaceae bacterium]